MLALPSRGMGCSASPGRVGGCGGEGQGGYLRYPGLAGAQTWLLPGTGPWGSWESQGQEPEELLVVALQQSGQGKPRASQ